MYGTCVLDESYLSSVDQIYESSCRRSDTWRSLRIPLYVPVMARHGVRQALTTSAVSGHGSQRPDDGDDEEDGKDESKAHIIRLSKFLISSISSAIWPSDVVVHESAEEAENVVVDDVRHYCLPSEQPSNVTSGD